MVVGAFPAAKLGVLAMKQISKPVANVLKTRAKNSPFFRTYICMPPAQFYNWVEVKTRMWAMNLGKPVSVPTLNEAQAIELGANLLGEFVIFAIGAGLLLLEYQRSARKEALKEALVEQEKAELHNYINELAFRLEKQDAQLREVERVVAQLHSSKWRPTKIISDLTSVGRSQDDKKVQPNSAPSTSQTSTETGNNQAQNVIFNALHMIENEIFYSEGNSEHEIYEESGAGFLTKPLIYLVGYNNASPKVNSVASSK